jgi:hypothetical protein
VMFDSLSLLSLAKAVLMSSAYPFSMKLIRGYLKY